MLRSSLPHTSVIGTPRLQYVGAPLPDVRLRLAQDGEIEIQSPGAFVGYYKQPELFQECFTTDGFFRTGDLGQLDGEGRLKLTGRKKELFKTGKGKYVAPAPIENKLGACHLIESAMVSGVGQVAPYALLVLNEAEQAKRSDAARREEVSTELAELLRDINATLADYEQLRMLVVAAQPFTVANGCLTPTLKLKRNVIEQIKEPKLESWYAQKGPVVWEL